MEEVLGKCMKNESESSAGAISGLKCIDLTRVLGGPYATMILADHGAEVIKIEPPEGDDVRDWGPPFRDNGNGSRDASYFLGINRNKRSVALDLSIQAGRDVLLRMLEGADVIIENFRPGTMERWKLDYPTLSKRFPRLVYCRISGFGSRGPMAALPGYDAIIQAMAGLMSVNGSVESGPTRVGTAVVDMATGLYSALAILMALFERSRSGTGQFIDMALYDCALTLLHPHAANHFLDGSRPLGTGNPHPNIAPYETYKTRSGEIFITAGNERQFQKLCEELGLSELLKDPRFGSNSDRLKNRSQLMDCLQASLLEKDGREICSRLLAIGVPAGPVRFIDEVMQDPHTKLRDMVVNIGNWSGVNTPIKFSRTRGGAISEPPQFGQDTDVIMRSHGYTEVEIESLKDSKVLRTSRGSRYRG